MDNADWVTSGAAIGDASIADYNSPSSVNLASTDGDDVTVGTITGTPDGVQIYRVDAAPNVMTPPGSITQLATEHYFGVFIAGGTSPTYTLTYNYEGHPGISNESSLDLAHRANNAAASWTEGNATLDQGTNTLTLTGQTGTEYILGLESSNPLPVELTSFTAASTSIETGKSVVVLKWETATEVNNYGFEILRSAQNDSHSESDSEDEESKWTKLSFMEGAGNSNSPKEYSFVDEYVQNGKYSYKLKQIDIDGNFEYSDEIEIEINVLPTEFALYQNYPNPFNPTTTITFGLPESGEVRLEILDILGQRIEVLFNEQMPAGYKTVVYNGANLSSGVYFYWLVVKGNTKDFSSIKKFMLMK
jgi:hypothetical protein